MPCYEFVCRLACAYIGITTTRAGSDINCNISNSGKRVPKSTHLLDTFAVDMSKINLKRVFEAKNGGIITVLTIMHWEVLAPKNQKHEEYTHGGNYVILSRTASKTNRHQLRQFFALTVFRALKEISSVFNIGRVAPQLHNTKKMTVDARLLVINLAAFLHVPV